jgi:exosome complex RNA-binding protein Rrp4
MITVRPRESHSQQIREEADDVPIYSSKDLIVFPTDALVLPSDTLLGRNIQKSSSQPGKSSSTVLGVYKQINKLAYIQPVYSSSYNPAVGDIVLAKLVENSGERWSLEIKNSTMPAAMPINLTPYGSQTIGGLKGSVEIPDLNTMMVVEVHKIHENEMLCHIRNGQTVIILENGLVVDIKKGVVKRGQSQIVNIEVHGIRLQAVLGLNGQVFIGAQPSKLEISPETRIMIGKGVQAIKYLDSRGMEISKENVECMLNFESYSDAVREISRKLQDRRDKQ